MLGFHIDMNMAHYRAEYLRKWLAELARLGYDTVLWEVENAIAWESCPECVAPDAFTKNEFRSLLAECRLRGLEPIPLLQTIGHAEYVLKHEKYRHLRELPHRHDQYCPRNAEVLPFLHAWIGEYLDLFGAVKHFHLGADESMCLGACPACKAYAEHHGLSRLYVDHVNAVARPLLQRGITPIVWADMALAWPEAIAELSQQVMLFDWRYDIYRGCGKVCVWSRAMRREGDTLVFADAMTEPADFAPAFREKFGRYLYPAGGQADAEPETFYTADFLADQGFRVVTCPAASHYGDNVFSPRDRLHTANVLDSVGKGMGAGLHGSLLTSWSVHLFPWELQLAYIGAPPFVRANPGGGEEALREAFVKERFGVRASAFFDACDLLSGACLFTNTATLGFGKSCEPVAPDHVQRTITDLRSENRLGREAGVCRERLSEYARALDLLRQLDGQVLRGQDLVRQWKLAARNLANRAEVSAFLLDHADAVADGAVLPPDEGQRARILLGRLRQLRKETDEAYAAMIKPTRRAYMVGCMFAAVERAMERLVGE
jgi:hypothetical protein